MATIGQPLTAPEAGWRRYDDTNNNITYTGVTWVKRNTSTLAYNNTDSYANGGGIVRFNFTGSRLRIIGIMSSTGLSDNIEVNIDGKVEKYSSYTSASSIWQALSYEKTNLSDGEHYVEIIDRKASTSDSLSIDCFDIDENGELLPFNILFPRLTLKNPSTNQYYSLADKTLIPLPDTSNKNMISFGIETGKEIKLDENFDKINYPVDGTIVATKVKPLSIKFE